jgi:hypothetical protein
MYLSNWELKFDLSSGDPAMAIDLAAEQNLRVRIAHDSLT